MLTLIWTVSGEGKADGLLGPVGSKERAFSCTWSSRRPISSCCFLIWRFRSWNSEVLPEIAFELGETWQSHGVMVSGDFAHVAVKAPLLGRRLFSYCYKPGLIVLVTSIYFYEIFTQKTITVHNDLDIFNINLKLSKLKFLSPVSSLLILCLVLVAWMRLLIYCCYQLPWTWGLKTPSPSLAIEGLHCISGATWRTLLLGFAKSTLGFGRRALAIFLLVLKTMMGLKLPDGDLVKRTLFPLWTLCMYPWL